MAFENSVSLVDFVKSVIATHIYDGRIELFKVPVQGFLIVYNSQHAVVI